MRKRAWIAIGGILGIVLFAGLGTARATQVWNENQARSTMENTRSSVFRALTHARQIGLLPSEIAPFWRRAHMLTLAVPPSSGVLWDSSGSAFYQRQTRAYRRLHRAIRARERQVTSATRAQAQAGITSARALLASARTLDIDVTLATSQLSRAYSELSVRRHPVQFRAVSGEVALITSTLDPVIAARQKTINTILASTTRSLPAIAARAEADVTSANDQISLLALFSGHTAGLSAALVQRDAMVKAQTDPVRAAVKLSELEAKRASIAADFQRVVPGKFILVSTEDQSARAYQDGKEIYSTDVTTGGPELPTDHGVFHIYAKISPFVFHSPWPPGSPYYYLPSPVTYWMPFDRAEGLHDAPWRSYFGAGSNLAANDLGDGNIIQGTHGCVNLPYDAAQFIWNWASVGTTVVVI